MVVANGHSGQQAFGKYGRCGHLYEIVLDQHLHQTAFQPAQSGPPVPVAQLLQLPSLYFDQLSFQLLKHLVTLSRIVKSPRELEFIGGQFYQSGMLDLGPGDTQFYSPVKELVVGNWLLVEKEEILS